MYFKISSIILFISAFSLADIKVPAGNAQLQSPIEWFTAGKDDSGRKIKYCGQLETNGKICFTPSNGYFTHGVQAVGESKRPFIKTSFIANNYAYLHKWTSTEQSLRWHIYFNKTGLISFNIELTPEASGSIIKAKLNDKSTTFRTEKDKTSYRITLPAQNGKNTFSLMIEEKAGMQIGKIYGIDVFGPAVKDAKLLRARWRPGAVHTRFSSSTTDKTYLWVMNSKSISPYTSYSPIVTPFGYYGASFEKDFRTSTSMNFSMWSKLDVPTEQMAHLLAVGSPQADFGGFGHEGTGVKLRGDWKPLATRPKILTQALRVTYTGNYANYYGYFLDPDTQNWQLFCAGKKWTPKKKQRPLWVSSFVEVPGPPNRQRSGDLRRQVYRKGWVMDAKNQWHQLDEMGMGKASNANKGWRQSNDGWFIMEMGGMEHYDYSANSKVTVQKKEKLPSFLHPDKVKQLYKMPVIFGHVSAKGSDINFEMKDASSNAKAIIYYGSKDCLTFAPRKLHGTEKKSSILKAGGTWAKSKEIKSVKQGLNTINIPDLKKTDFFRILIINDAGRQWTDSTYKARQEVE